MFRPGIRHWALWAVAGMALSCGGGNFAYRQARKAELRKDWDTALVNYQTALRIAPENAKYVIHERLARTNASLLHLKRGRDLLAGNRPDDAAGEFQKAVSIDPSNQAAAQELAKVLAAQAEAKKQREEKLKEALKANEEPIPPTVQLKPLPQERMHFKITGPSRQVFGMIGKLADLNVAFTADFQDRPVTVDLTDVRVEDILKIVAYQTKSFWKVVTPNTILIIPDTPGTRREYEDQVVKTVYLSNPLQAQERAAITTAVKTILMIQKIVDNPDANALVVSDTPEKVAEAERLIHDLDRGKAEILIDVQVVEADLNRVRDLGLTPATVSATGSVTPGLQGGVGFAPQITTSSSGTTTGGVNLHNIGSTLAQDYAVVLPSAAANAVLNDARTHILQSPQVRTTDGQKAALHIGSRVPFATGSFGFPGVGVGGTGTAGGGGVGNFGLLANTQFQFQDVGVTIDLTPHLEPDGEIAIHAVIDISSVGPSQSFGGITEPTFNQRKIEHDIRLKEGEVSLLGGLIQTQVIHNVSGTPFLGQVPLLRYLFSTEHVERTENEVLVMLTPRVVRLPEIPTTAGASRTVNGTPTPEPVPGSLPLPGGPPR